jgi:hypothetical protein
MRRCCSVLEVRCFRLKTLHVALSHTHTHTHTDTHTDTRTHTHTRTHGHTHGHTGTHTDTDTYQLHQHHLRPTHFDSLPILTSKDPEIKLKILLYAEENMNIGLSIFLLLDTPFICNLYRYNKQMA